MKLLQSVTYLLFNLLSCTLKSMYWKKQALNFPFLSLNYVLKKGML